MYRVVLGALFFLSACFSVHSYGVCDPDDIKCLLKHDKRNVSLVSVHPEQNATLPCRAFLPYSISKVEWWFGRRSKLLGTWTNDGDFKLNYDRYEFAANASLLAIGVDRHLVEEYECVAFYTNGQTSSSFVLLRLDYSFFYEGPIFGTVFWGSCATSLIFCVSSFILNIVWIIIRKLSLWLIDRSERLSRVRNTLEAMEKYRSKQMDNLQENYQKRVTAIRESYHQQVDEIRVSYSKQADRFRDYRQTQVEAMTQHLDNIRDNYNQQLGRIKEYGSRRAERLVESYERQLNRMRTFTLQHRLKLMRQYKVKEHHINDLLANIEKTENQQTIHENKDIREMLDLPGANIPKSNFSSSSVPFYSLPDLTILDDCLLDGVAPIDFVRYSFDTNKEIKPDADEIPASSKITNENEPETSQASANTPFFKKHHRRKSSNLRTLSFTEIDCHK
ncbi:Leucine Rich Repeat family protein [Aphelenchoides bicaudatus]|nr:Leucine Rich Repeat family protein [Aphelenchoides bicaudatus]